MLEVLKKTANKTYTENGAVTYRTSGKDCLDLFATIGALRHADDEDIRNRFLKAYAENRDLAMKILFYARDVRGGLGERRVFRSILTWLASNEKGSVVKNLPFIERAVPGGSCRAGRQRRYLPAGQVAPLGERLQSGDGHAGEDDRQSLRPV